MNSMKGYDFERVNIGIYVKSLCVPEHPGTHDCCKHQGNCGLLKSKREWSKIMSKTAEWTLTMDHGLATILSCIGHGMHGMP